jgi:hypothetical protein
MKYFEKIAFDVKSTDLVKALSRRIEDIKFSKSVANGPEDIARLRSKYQRTMKSLDNITGMSKRKAARLGNTEKGNIAKKTSIFGERLKPSLEIEYKNIFGG